MVHELKIPQAGESIQEVQIGQWLKKEGEWVDRDENLVELETDKASMELSAPAAGVVTKILKKDGEAAGIGEIIALIDEAAPPPKAEAAEAKAAPQPSEPRIVMPSAQRLLTEHGIQAEEVRATGPAGRVLKEDVLRHVEKKKQEKSDGEPAKRCSVKRRPQRLAPCRRPPRSSAEHAACATKKRCP